MLSEADKSMMSIMLLEVRPTDVGIACFFVVSGIIVRRIHCTALPHNEFKDQYTTLHQTTKCAYTEIRLSVLFLKPGGPCTIESTIWSPPVSTSGTIESEFLNMMERALRPRITH